MIGVGERPAEWLDDELRSWMPHYHQVSTVVDAGVLTDTVRHVQGYLWVDRLEATIEAHTLAAAQARENCTDPRHVRAHGVAVPRQAVDEGRAAGRRRPDRGVGGGRERCRGARVRRLGRLPDRAQAAHRRRRARHHPRRRPRPARAGPGPLRRAGGRVDRGRGVRRGPRGLLRHADHRRDTSPSTSSRTTTRTCSRRCARGGSPRSSSPRTGSTRPPDYQELRDLGARVNAALGIGTTATHMEWFFGPKGLRFSEIGCRPPGVGAWDLYSAGNDVDLYREWANAVVHGHVAAHPSRRLRHRDRRPAAGPRRAHHRLLRGRRGPGPPRRVGDRRAPAATRHAHAARRGRVLGERLRADAPPRLRRAARHARRRRAARVHVYAG